MRAADVLGDLPERVTAYVLACSSFGAHNHAIGASVFSTDVLDCELLSCRTNTPCLFRLPSSFHLKSASQVLKRSVCLLIVKAGAACCGGPKINQLQFGDHSVWVETC